MNPYLLDFLEGLAGLICGWAIVAIPVSIWKKKHPKQEKEAQTPKTYSSEPRPGSDAHYAAWREEQRKKAGEE